MAWSIAARYDKPLPGCRGHKHCGNCRRYALRWRADVLRAIGAGLDDGAQLLLFNQHTA